MRRHSYSSDFVVQMFTLNNYMYIVQFSSFDFLKFALQVQAVSIICKLLLFLSNRTISDQFDLSAWFHRLQVCLSNKVSFFIDFICKA